MQQMQHCYANIGIWHVETLVWMHSFDEFYVLQHHYSHFHLFNRKFDCAHKLSFKFVYPSNPAEKTKVACLVCQKKFDNVTYNFMVAHRYDCHKKIQSPNVNSSQVAALSSHVVLNDQRPANNYSVGTTMPINLNQLQFNKFRFQLGGNEFHFGVQCRLCKEVFVMDTLKLLQHRYALNKYLFVRVSYELLIV